MKTKFLLPGLAVIFAIGMSFTTVNKDTDPNQDYILENGVYQPIGMELNCGEGTITCQVQFGPNGTVHEVYDAIDDKEPKTGGGGVIEL